MRLEVNGVRLFFDVEGPKLVPDGPVMRERPTLILLHGGPGQDHSAFRPLFPDRLADIAQIVYIDHRGNGRSDREPRDSLNLPQQGDDVFALCQALEIEKPIVWGQSFGGFVAISYATRHPEHPGKLIFSSTKAQARTHAERSIAMFAEKGGPEIEALARRHHTIGSTPEDLGDWMTKAMPLYGGPNRPARDPDVAARGINSARTFLDFARPGGEGMTFDMLDGLRDIQCPTLVFGGEDDPQTPIEYQEDIANAIRPELVRFERFANAGHGPYLDDPDAVFGVVRDFILS